MRPRLGDLALGVVACLAVWGAAHRWPNDVPPILNAPSPVTPPASPGVAIDPESLEVAMSVILESAPFRRTKQITPAPQAVTVQTPVAAAAALTLKAIVGGPPWQAVLAGMLGEQETLVAIGSEVRGLRVESITREAVVLRGGDSTWTLTMRAIPR